MSRRSYVLFLTFVWIALVYIIVAFTDVTALAFVGKQTLENGQEVSGGGIATSSLLYLLLPILMGVLLRYTKLSIGWATLIFLPLVGVTIWLGQKLPFDVGKIFNVDNGQAQKIWDVALLLYCLVAAVVPVWLLLQPRGHLGGYFLYVAIFGGIVGLVVGSLITGGESIRYPAFVGWNARGLPDGKPLLPILFITIACGACSGFHSIIASGTTSKQLRCEPDARQIGYGAMLLEAMVAILSLSCVMILSTNAPSLQAAKPSPNLIYAEGIGRFLAHVGIPAQFAVSFALMAFATFVYDTLDVCTRLGRYIIQELTGLTGMVGRLFGTALTAGVPLFFLLQPSTEPVWSKFWELFGASNQLLAALTLLGVTVWLWRTYRAKWVWLVTGLPAAFMYTMSTWALILMIQPAFQDDKTFFKPTSVTVVAILLVALAAAMLLEAVIVITSASRKFPPPKPPLRKPASVPA
jgi:carbon starvation protein